MFNQSPDERLSSWSQFRKDLDQALNPLHDTVTLWTSAPFVPYNTDVDPYNQFGWPTPWEILINNKYDDFTKALMMSWTLKLTNRYKDSKIEIKTVIDTASKLYYNIVCVDDNSVLNYVDNEVVNIENLPDTFRLENLIEVHSPR